ncbi:EAL domain-containing protein [Bacillus sp. MM2020_4]|nr:EAL domain-containing protein [Bacillus sp. MM2020_4]
MLLFLILLFIVIRPYLLKDSVELDKQTTQKDIERVKNHLLSTMDGLNRTNRDWAVWDDSFSFLTGDHSDFPKVNLQNDTFENNMVNFIIYLNKKNELVYQGGYDLQRHEPLELNADFYQAFLPIIQSKSNLHDTLLVSTNFGLTMSSLQSVYRSNNGGPSPGTLIMGKMISETTIRHMGEALSLPLTIKETKNRTAHLHVNVKPISETKIRGSLFLKSYSKQKAYEISLVNKRSFYLQKKVNIKQLFVYLILTTLFFILIIIVFLNHFVLTRVQDLSLQLKNIQNNKDLKSRIRLSNRQKDELLNLEGSINKMLASLEEKHNNITNLAFFDQLTSIPNRYMFFKEFSKRVGLHNQSFAVLFFDLDGFKWVNDSLGHKIGDILLNRVCQRVLPLIEEQDGIMARYGGDEFVILLQKESRVEIEEVAQKVMSAVGKEYQIHSFKTFVTASVGISMYPNDGYSMEQLLQNADIAMYEAKRKGKNQFIFFQDLTSDDSYRNLLEFEKDLKDALLNRQFELYYQVIVNGDNKRIAGVEALLRWNHPTKGIIPPATFIPIAEETGMMPSIGLWVLEDAVKQMKKWYQSGYDDLVLSVNISKSQMKDSSFIEKLDQILTKFQFPAHMLQLEITESDIEHYLREIDEFTKELKSRGVKIALDDFGVGTSSLLYLKELPIDVIKIDRSFIKDVPMQSFDSILLMGMLEIFSDLNMTIIVEGIEEEAQIEFICSKFQAKLQGYYFSRPIPAAMLELEFLNKRSDA